ncbi:MAG: hypothetical protein JKX78_10335 [Alteromonadaceae bacterium]|nr:hypothetical protein [Alteromonadaceae bacterium]
MTLAHGDSIVEFKDKIIFVALDGAFNKEGVADWIQKIKVIINNLNGERFGMLMDMREALGGTPESFELSNQYNAWLNKQNLVAKALIYGSSVFEDMDKTLVPSKKYQNTKVFDNAEQAKLWLVSELIAVS